MSLHFNEFYNGATGLTVGIGKQLFREQTPFQLVEVFETDTWGNLMTIDGMVMLSEKDEFVYHEMMAHVPLLTHPNPKTVLIIGGGDGGTAREVLKHPGVEQVDMVEIDEAVVRASKLYMPEVGDFENPKLNVIYENGLTFVDGPENKYDVIIIDGSDPVGPAVDLFKKDFYEKCHHCLKTDGVLVSQTESPFVESYHDSIRSVQNAISDLFPIAKLFLTYIPLYPTGMWSMSIASKKRDPLSDEVTSDINNRLSSFADTLKYYNQDVHSGCFALPGFVRQILK
ncbi:MAG: polyamine aminopropyltransferase [Balneolales bacterium]|nr:polyamine aminopropyltransferase [Balneolales bacterium]